VNNEFYLVICLLISLVFYSCSCDPEEREISQGDLDGLKVGLSVVGQMDQIMDLKEWDVKSNFNRVNSCQIGKLNGTYELRLIKGNSSFAVDVINGQVDNGPIGCVLGVCNDDTFDGNNYCGDSVVISLVKFSEYKNDSLSLLPFLEGDQEMFFANKKNDRYILYLNDGIVTKVRYEEYGGCPGSVY
jgi:hypothetical protein